jgi:MFS family permease
MNRDLIIVSISLATWGFGEGLFFFFQPLYLQELGANPVQIGDILSIVSIAMAVAHLPAGFLADRLGRRPMMIAAWLVGTISTWIMALATNLPWFVVGARSLRQTSFVVGLCTATSRQCAPVERQPRTDYHFCRYNVEAV